MKTLLKNIYLGDVQCSELICNHYDNSQHNYTKMFVNVLRFDRSFYRVMLDRVTFANTNLLMLKSAIYHILYGYYFSPFIRL